MEQKDKPAYYSIITADVRYDKDLSPNAKLLYSEVTALCNQKGFCWATNAYFAELYGVHKNTISAWISALTDKGYLFIEMYTKEDKSIERRLHVKDIEKISIKSSSPLQDKTYPPSGNAEAPLQENLNHNTTLNNKVNNNTTTSTEKSDSDIQALFKKKYIDLTNLEFEQMCMYLIDRPFPGSGAPKYTKQELEEFCEYWLITQASGKPKFKESPGGWSWSVKLKNWRAKQQEIDSRTPNKNTNGSHTHQSSGSQHRSSNYRGKSAGAYEAADILQAELAAYHQRTNGTGT